MKLWVKITATILLIFVVSIAGTIGYKVATRPKVNNWTAEQIHSIFPDGTSKEDVLSLIGNPHVTMADGEGWIYYNSYLKTPTRHRLKIPQNFTIFIKNGIVTDVWSRHY